MFSFVIYLDTGALISLEERFAHNKLYISIDTSYYINTVRYIVSMYNCIKSDAGHQYGTNYPKTATCRNRSFMLAD